MKTKQSDKNTEKTNLVENALGKTNMRKLILLAASTTGGISLPQIKKFLYSKEKRRRPEMKLVLKNLLMDGGHIVKHDGKCAAKDRIPRKPSIQKRSTDTAPKQKCSAPDQEINSSVGRSRRPEMKLFFKSLQDDGHIVKHDGGYILNPAKEHPPNLSIQKRSTDSAPKQKLKNSKSYRLPVTRAAAKAMSTKNRSEEVIQTDQEINSSVDLGNVEDNPEQNMTEDSAILN